MTITTNPINRLPRKSKFHKLINLFSSSLSRFLFPIYSTAISEESTEKTTLSLKTDIWIVVIANKINEAPNAFILLPEEVKELAGKCEKEGGNVSYWLELKSYKNDKYSEKWDRISEI